MLELAPKDFQRWKFDLRSVCGQFDARRSIADRPFYGEARRCDLGDLEMARIQSNAASIARARRYSSDDKHCFLVLQLSGHQHLCCDGMEPVELRAGELMVLDPTVPFEMLQHGFVDNFSIHLPYRLLASRLPNRTFGGKLRSGGTSTQMLAALMQQLKDTTPGYRASTAETDALRQSLVNLLVPSLEPSAPRQGRDSETSELYRVATNLIGSHLGADQLGPEWLAQRLRVSRRQLYRAFAEQGHAGVAHFILDYRLEQAAARLRDGNAFDRSIGQIAAEVGLDDLAHFSRAFRRRFSVAPSRYRAMRTC